MPKRSKKSADAKSMTKDVPVPEYVSDDDQLYGNVADPDPSSREYFYDAVDEFHANREKIMLDQGVQEFDDNIESDEEEVLALDSEESDDDEIRDLKSQLRRVRQSQTKADIGSDVDEEQDDDMGLPDSKAWGKKRKKYYGDDDIELSDLEDEDAEAVLEEKEALKLQRQMAEQLDDQDFGLDMFKPKSETKEPSEKEEKIIKDLSKLSKREQLQLLKTESPELLTFIDEFKDKMSEVKDKLQPLRALIEKKNITGKAANYVHTKFQLNLNYCTNIVFYLILKAKQTPVHNHPVIKRLLQYRNLLQQLEPLDLQMETEVNDLVTRLNNGEDISFQAAGERDAARTFVRRKKQIPTTSKPAEKKAKLSEIVADTGEESDDMYEELGPKSKPEKKGKNKSEGRYETSDEKAALDYYDMMKEGRNVSDEEKESGEESGDVGAGDMAVHEAETNGKRAIGYQIQKNKGLTAHKKKELRNPRVKHRAKYRKAKIRMKGKVREVRSEVHRYGGELSGIRAGIKRGIKLK